MKDNEQKEYRMVSKNPQTRKAVAAFRKAAASESRQEANEAYLEGTSAMVRVQRTPGSGQDMEKLRGELLKAEENLDKLEGGGKLRNALDRDPRTYVEVEGALLLPPLLY